METYQEAAEYLGKKNERPVPYGSPRGTVVRRLDDDSIAIIYHGTAVVTYLSNGFTVLSGRSPTGKVWRSPTTKQRINDYSPCAVIQRDFEWFVMDKNNVRIEFEDGITVGPDGYPLRDADDNLVFDGHFRAVVTP